MRRLGREGEGCTSVGLGPRPGQPTLIGQTPDLPAINEGAQTVLRLGAADRPDAILVTQAGALASLGVNSDGVGVCVNSLPQLDYAIDGLPVCFVVRGVLARRTLTDAVEFMRTVHHASGQNYVVGSPEGVVSLVCSARSVVEFHPFVDRDDVSHTELYRRETPLS
jgi:hypothetical protein